jgi:D-arabinose 1-dehydrogenase-like Zn-dependent alcohol dehydrogenase
MAAEAEILDAGAGCGEQMGLDQPGLHGALMRAVVMHEFGAEDVLRLEDVEAPRPGPGEVQVRVGAVEVSRTRDVATRTGKHPFSQFVTLPHIPGGDFAGVVEEVGEGVDARMVGQRVTASATQTCGECSQCRIGRQERCAQLSLLGVHRRGSYAELAVVESGAVRPIPDELPLAEAAALAADGPIAFHQLETAAPSSGDYVLVTGATGALGTTLAALGPELGAKVIGLARRPEAIPAGLELASRLDADDPELTAKLQKLAGATGVSVAIDNVANPDAFSRYFSALAIGARVVFSGAIATPEGLPVLPVPAVPLYVKSISLLGTRTSARSTDDRFWKLVADGFRLPPGLVHEMPLEQAAEAQAQIAAGTQLGHTILTIGS